MERSPITKARSAWRELVGEPFGRALSECGAQWFVRNVSDGYLRCLVAEEPMGWHLSISFVDHKGAPSRYPRWDEIAHARDELLDADLEFVMFLPRSGEYVALHASTFHLHEHPARQR